jgi:hypothetical protein
MTKTGFDAIEAEISRAGVYAKAGQHRLAAQSFTLLRAFMVDLADVASLRQAITAQRVPLRAAREAFRAAVAGRCADGQRILFLTDTAALAHAGTDVDQTFSGQLAKTPSSFRVDTIGQEGFITTDILTLLNNAPRLGAQVDVIVMIGQHDSAQTMLEAHERAAMALLPRDQQTLILDLIAQYGTEFVPHLPVRPAVSADMFAANIDSILRALQARGARRIFVVTLLSQTDRRPYNAALELAAERAGATLLDFDRLARHLASDVSTDGHWSKRLHSFFADVLANALTMEPTEPADLTDVFGDLAI